MVRKFTELGPKIFQPMGDGVKLVQDRIDIELSPRKCSFAIWPWNIDIEMLLISLLLLESNITKINNKIDIYTVFTVDNQNFPRIFFMFKFNFYCLVRWYYVYMKNHNIYMKHASILIILTSQNPCKYFKIRFELKYLCQLKKFDPNLNRHQRIQK